MGRPNKSGYAPVHLAAKEGRKKILELMINHNKGCVGIENKKGNTPLHLAARAGFTFSCRYVQRLVKLSNYNISEDRLVIEFTTLSDQSYN